MADSTVPRLSMSPSIDGQLADWSAVGLTFRYGGPEQPEPATDPVAADLSAELRLAFESSCLFLGGWVRDDVTESEHSSLEELDSIEVVLSAPAEGARGSQPARILLMPWSERRPWALLPEPGSIPVSDSPVSDSAVPGMRLATNRGPGRVLYFEAAIPFNLIAGIQPGTREIGLDLVLHDRDGPRPIRHCRPARDGVAATGLQPVRLDPPGCLVDEEDPRPAGSLQLLQDLALGLLPLLGGILLLVAARLGPRVSRSWRGLRRAAVVGGVLAFALGLVMPTLLADLRARAQARSLDQVVESLQRSVAKLEEGTLASYRGASRDRALIDLLAGKSIARQKYTSYRFLSRLSPGDFGSSVRLFPDELFAVRPYWLPLGRDRVETVHFDPPLHGEALYVVLGRPHTTPFSPHEAQVEAPRLRCELQPLGRGQEARVEELEFQGAFASGGSLGRELYEVAWQSIDLTTGISALSLVAENGEDLRLVGLSLRTVKDEPAEPLYVGTASISGVQTDLRGPWPLDAGIELAPGGRTRIAVPQWKDELPQRMWLFYRATYPGVPTHNPGSRVAEVTLHFRDNAVPPRTIVLEHQVSMFYELMVHNTRDAPPDGAPAAIGFRWVDEANEPHVNLELPITDLPAGAAIEAIEFRNVAAYRIRFRSVVFGIEKAAAPQDPVDSPLVVDGQDRALQPELRRELAKAVVHVHRDGRLSESTIPVDRRHLVQPVPRTLPAGSPVTVVEESSAGERRLTSYSALSGDGWDGAVLGVAMEDPGYGSACSAFNLLGFGLCLLGVPALLMLLGELLALVTNLRLRLMAVLTVASLAPLVLLSLLFAQVLERSHARDQRDGVQHRVASALRQLEAQKERLRASAAQWLSDLLRDCAAKVGDVPEDQRAAALPRLSADLRTSMAGQLPPEWRGGFFRLEWNPGPGSRGEAVRPLVVGAPSLADVDTPARLDPGLYLHWGAALLAVRAEDRLFGGTMALTVGRPVDADYLGALVPGQAILLTDTRGHLVVAAGPRSVTAPLLATIGDVEVMAAFARAVDDSREARQIVVDNLATSSGDWLFAADAMLDLQATPRALLAVLQPDQRATLDLAIGRVAVRPFFLLVAGLFAVFAVFLAFLVSGRISRPIERLEQGAQAIADGELDVRVPGAEEGGQIGRLTRTFNGMAADLQGRLLDLQALNRANRDLSAQLDAGHAIDVLRRFCEQHASADRLRVVLFTAESGRVDVHGADAVERIDLPPELQFLPRAAGTFCLAQPGRGPDTQLLPTVMPSMGSVLGLPLSVAGRCRGAVLLGFERREPRQVDLDLLATVVAQAAVALENAELYRHAVQDPVTGAWMPDYFKRRVVDEVALHQERGLPLSVLALWLGDGTGRPRGLRRFAIVLRDNLPANAVLCHAGSGQFQILVPMADRPQAEALLGRLLEAWHVVVLAAAEGEIETRRPAASLVTFPAEAVSAEFLFDALRSRLADGLPVDAAFIDDESLQREGVTALSPPMRDVYATLRRVAPTDLSVLLEGETGTGKEVLTNLLHRWSKRANGPLVKVHCAALSETLLQSELFGHEKGAFTGADRRKIGKFEQANGGTIFLDELGEVSLDVQVKLLRVLQEREIDRVGGNETVPVDVRVVAATNRDLAKMVAEGRFREDLYYRLAGVVVRVPPLRERRQEIPALVEHFRCEIVAAGHSQVRAFSTEVMDELYRRDWPGNIRELRNVVGRLLVLAAGDVVRPRDLQSLGAPAGQPVPTGQPAGVLGQGVPAMPMAPPATDPFRADGGAVEGQEAGRGERVVEIPRIRPARPESSSAGLDGAGAPGAANTASPKDANTLPPRLRALYEVIVAKGVLATSDHMTIAGVSHRTGLRDLQELVRLGLVIRSGSRRGARYRPSAGGIISQADTGARPTPTDSGP